MLDPNPEIAEMRVFILRIPGSRFQVGCSRLDMMMTKLG